jgi:hypothetical protein
MHGAQLQLSILECRRVARCPSSLRNATLIRLLQMCRSNGCYWNLRGFAGRVNGCWCWYRMKSNPAVPPISPQAGAPRGRRLRFLLLDHATTRSWTAKALCENSTSYSRRSTAARLIRKGACRQIARGMIQLLEAAFVFVFADRLDGSGNLHCSRRPLRCSYSTVAAQGWLLNMCPVLISSGAGWVPCEIQVVKPPYRTVPTRPK